MFGLFKKKKDKAHVLGAPAKGKAVSLKEVSDPTFSEGMLGEGVAVIPEEGKFYAPCDGEIGMVFDTLHAVSLTSDFGAEVLICEDERRRIYRSCSGRGQSEKRRSASGSRSGESKGGRV